MRKEPSGCFSEYRYSKSFFLWEPAAVRGGTCIPPPTQLLPATRPVDDTESLLGADDAERVDGGVGGGEVRVLAGTPPKSTLGALAPPQELADTAGRWGRGSVSPVSPRWGDTSLASLVNPLRVEAGGVTLPSPSSRGSRRKNGRH